MTPRGPLLAERLRRHGLLRPVRSLEEYLVLFARLQPVPPPYFSYPGSPPSLTHRAALDEAGLAGDLRERHVLVKGRFLRGTIGYVLADDLATYANAFRRPLGEMNPFQRAVHEALAADGPLTPRQVAEETGLRIKEAMPALHRLQEAFLVYEDQVTTDWERGWSLFEAEWPDIALDGSRRDECRVAVLERFLEAHVFATARQVADWSGWPAKEVTALLEAMAGEDRLEPESVEGLGEGWRHASARRLSSRAARPTCFLLHKGDSLAQSHASELKARYRGLEVLQYLLIDGAFQGAVLGHWRIGPHDVEDIVLELPEGERASRKEEILHAVGFGYRPPFSSILRYDGREL